MPPTSNPREGLRSGRRAGTGTLMSSHDATAPVAPPIAEPASVHDGARDRAFVWGFLGVLALLAGFVVAMDPFAQYHTGLVPTLVREDRHDKLALARRQTHMPQLLVMGSSRSETIDPVELEARTGKVAFNLSLGSASAEDLYAFYHVALDDLKWPIHTLLIGIDVDMFYPHSATNPSLAAVGVAHYLPADFLVQRDFTIDALSSHSFLHAWRSLGYVRTGFPAAKTKLLDNGMRQNVDADARLADGSFVLSDELERGERVYAEGLKDMSALSTARAGLLSSLMAQAQGRGIAVWLFLTPLHPHAYAALDQQRDYTALLQLVRAWLKHEHDTHAVEVFDASHIDSFSGDPAAFYDAVHMQPANMTRLVSTLCDAFAGGTAHAVQ